MAPVDGHSGDPALAARGKSRSSLHWVGEMTEPIFSCPSVGPTDVGSGRENLLGQQK